MLRYVIFRYLDKIFLFLPTHWEISMYGLDYNWFMGSLLLQRNYLSGWKASSGIRGLLFLAPFLHGWKHISYLNENFLPPRCWKMIWQLLQEQFRSFSILNKYMHPIWKHLLHMVIHKSSCVKSPQMIFSMWIFYSNSDAS